MPLISLWIFCLGEAICIKKTGIQLYYCLDIVNIHLLAKNYKLFPVVWNLNVHISSDNFALVRLFIKKSGIRQSHWLGLVIIYLHTKNYQNIPSGLKVIHHIQFLKILSWWHYLQEWKAGLHTIWCCDLLFNLTWPNSSKNLHHLSFCTIFIKLNLKIHFLDC